VDFGKRSFHIHFCFLVFKFGLFGHFKKTQDLKKLKKITQTLNNSPNKKILLLKVWTLIDLNKKWLVFKVFLLK